MEKFASNHGVHTHYLDHPGSADRLPILLMHGLTANAHSFAAVVEAGLSPAFRTLAVDFRGRGASDKPTSGYSVAEHAADMLAVLDAAGIERAHLVGHSFGGLIAFYLAAHHPERVGRLVILDSSVLLVDPSTLEAIKLSLSRLGTPFPSADAYLERMRGLPFWADAWDAHVEAYYRADLQDNADGTVSSRIPPHAIQELVENEFTIDWQAVNAGVTQPVLLLHATQPYGAAPIVSAEVAQQTVAMLKDCRYQPINANHVSMLFGAHAQQLADAIRAFLA